MQLPTEFQEPHLNFATPINTHNYRTAPGDGQLSSSSSAMTILAVENASFVNRSCTYDIDHKHGGDPIGIALLACRICNSLRITQGCMKPRKCIETHLKAR